MAQALLYRTSDSVSGASRCSIMRFDAPMNGTKNCVKLNPSSAVLAAGERGFTLLEIMVVVVMVGILVAIGLPKIGNQLDLQNLRAARQLITTMHAQARA